MRTWLPHTAQRRAARRGLTLVELMVAVSVLSLIVLVLFRMFDQTQKALRANVAQVDVMEGGRAIMDLLRRDLESVMPRGGTTNNVNLYVGLASARHTLQLPGGTNTINEFDEIYFLKPNRNTAINQLWDATVYRVLSRTIVPGSPLDNPVYRTNRSNEGVGWLARRTLKIDEATVKDPNDPTEVFMDADWRSDPRHPLPKTTTTNEWWEFSRVADGIVHFKLTPLDSRGQPVYLEELVSGEAYPYGPEVLSESKAVGGDVGLDSFFLGSTLPASLRVELGILEPQVTDRLRSLPNVEAKTQFLQEQAAKIHYFEQRIPMPSAPKLLPK